MQMLQQGWAWLLANKLMVLAVVVWVLANVVKRPHPEELEGWQKIFWTVIDRLCVLTADALPGKVKWLFAASPAPISTPPPVPPANNSKENGNA